MRNRCSRKVNQFVSIFSATDSVLNTEVRGQVCSPGYFIHVFFCVRSVVLVCSGRSCTTSTPCSSSCGKEKNLPQLRDALPETIFKKGDNAEHGNSRRISILSRVLANRLLPLSEGVLRESAIDPAHHNSSSAASSPLKLTDSEVNRRLRCASGAYARFSKRVSDRDLKVQTKLSVYIAEVLPTLLCGAESWTPYSPGTSPPKILYILRISILEEANVFSITIMQHQLGRTDRVIRLTNSGLLKQILYSQLEKHP